MTDALLKLIEKTRGIRMTEEQMRDQRISFVYGNTKLENDLVTQDMVVDADRRVAEDVQRSKVVTKK